MTPHEKRADECIQAWIIAAVKGEGETFLHTEIVNALTEAHTAGFEAGLKARLPSETRIEVEAITRFGNPTMTSTEGIHWCRYKDAFKQGVAWLAANMRKGEE